MAFPRVFPLKVIALCKTHCTLPSVGISCAAAMLLCIPGVQCADWTLALVLTYKLLLKWMYIEKSFLMLQDLHQIHCNLYCRSM